MDNKKVYSNAPVGQTQTDGRRVTRNPEGVPVGATYGRRKSQNSGENTHVGNSERRAPAGNSESSAPIPSQGNKPVSAAPKNGETGDVRVKGGFDRMYLILVIVMYAFGTVMVYSASFPYAIYNFGDSNLYLTKQLTYLCIGAVVMLFLMFLDYKWTRALTVIAFLVMNAFLILVLILGTSRGVAQRWMTIFGFRFQPSEFMKPVLVLTLALFFARFQSVITDYRNFWKSSFWGIFIPYAIVGFVSALIALEMHFSGTIIMFLIGSVVIFVGGGRKFWFGAVGGAVTVLLSVAILFTDYAKKRIEIWLHPERFDPQGDVWQTLQGLNAVGSGGLFGVGIGNSRQKYSYVSEPHNDFIFSIICEELGFIGAFVVVLLFALLIWRGFIIAMRAPDTFSTLVVVGITGKIAIQMILNIAVVTSLIPNTGITLPFFSAGGSALIASMAETGIVLSISRFSYQKK